MSVERPPGVSVSLDPDPVIEAYKKDIDRTLIRENLKLTHEERLLQLMKFQEFVEELHLDVVYGRSLENIARVVARRARRWPSRSSRRSSKSGVARKLDRGNSNQMSQFALSKNIRTSYSPSANTISTLLPVGVFTSGYSWDRWRWPTEPPPADTAMYCRPSTA